MRDSDSAHTQLHGPWLTIARVAWIATASLILILFTYGLVAGFGQLRTVCTAPEAACHPDQLDPELAELNKQLGASLNFYGWFKTITFAVFGYACFAIAWLIFMRRSDDWMALFVSLFLIGLATINPVIEIAGPVIFLFASAMLFPFLCLFPDGRFVPRWTRWLVVAWILSQVVIAIVEPFPARGVSSGPPHPIVQVFFLIGLSVQVYRYRRVSTPSQRQQTKWVVLGIAGWTISLAAILLSLAFFPDLSRPGPLEFAFDRYAFPFVGLLPILFIPLTIGISILRFRLWDVDQLIRRSLAYSALTVVLALAYFVSVVSFQRLLPNQTVLATVVSTLVTAALFTPLRRRLQVGIDRRFYRRRYDIERTLAEFGARIRDRVELDELEYELIAVASRTLEPAFISLWLAPQSSTTPFSTAQGESL